MTAPIRPPVRPAALTLLAALLVTAALGAGAVALAPDSVRTPLAWGAALVAVALSAAAGYIAHARASVALLRRRTEEMRHTADRGAAERARAESELAQERDARVRDAAELTAQLRTARAERAAALAACANAAGRMQALATGMLADLREMEHRHTDEDVLADLLHLDHRTAQAGRLADSVAVLTGARSGRRWARPIAMESILRGAMGRIGGYQRVRVHAPGQVAVAGHAAEGVMHVLAELLDNAANFSPPTAEVHVYVEDVPAGVIVSVEDAGLVMGPVQLRRAERAVSGGTSGLGGLSGTRLGLAVVGRLARKHGLTVSFRPSARGGTGVLLLIPQELLSRTTDTPAPAPATTPAPATHTATAVVADGTSPYDSATHEPAADDTHPGLPTRARTGHERTSDDGDNGSDGERDRAPDSDSGLPKRARGRTLAAARRAQARAAAPAETGREVSAPAESPAARFSSFRQAVRATPPPAGEAATTTEQPLEDHTQEGDTPQ
ncbi:sensor histidine kinase KdpD [Streptomyces sp. VRA16 Mangrove soil]|uniref:sensor histidine kinase n=1 Tax=Streptomyces sp. VRA16 Mangrove soil TaxID=2817434 RepID=UPI001A9E3152|nr:ATP-binding protein [Streptomyces sp. VRA16 Mangrove soil]MBO1337620.1 sensor histidine kinase [Streptomyces sp. VRA16 Mangrove soil]